MDTKQVMDSVNWGKVLSIKIDELWEENIRGDGLKVSYTIIVNSSNEGRITLSDGRVERTGVDQVMERLKSAGNRSYQVEVESYFKRSEPDPIRQRSLQEELKGKR